MLTRVERHRDQTYIQIESVFCDRCGEKLVGVTGFVSEFFPFRGIAIRGKMYAEDGDSSKTRNLEIELCDLCTEKLITWVGAEDDVLDRKLTYEKL